MIVFDLETTGLPKAEGSDLEQQPQIIELGAIKLDDDLNEVDRIEKPFVEHFPEVCEFFLGEREMCAHNLAFDRKILRFELERLDKMTKFPWPPKHICTVEIGQSVWGKRRKLVDLYEEITGEVHKGAHRATADVEALIEVFKWFRKEGHA